MLRLKLLRSIVIDGEVQWMIALLGCRNEGGGEITDSNFFLD